MVLIRKLRARALNKALFEQKAFYEQSWTSQSILEWQLGQWNRIWASISEGVPYFHELKREKKLPPAFRSWREFKEKMPLLDRQTVKRRLDDLIHQKKKPDGWQSTGGSTAEPLQVPIWKEERKYATKDIWYARNWFGISPSDKLFLIWGHSHLLGKGFKGWLNGTTRRLKDCLLGYHRFSAYDLSESRLKEAAQELLRFRPAYLLGYAAALDRFARVNQKLRARFQHLRLKAVIATAESFPKEDSSAVISELFGCSVVMEYGSVETGPLAYQQESGDYFVFWQNYFLEGIPSDQIPDAHEVVVTSLYPRCFPLVRYKVGDLVVADDGHNLNLSFKKVLGRSNDLLILDDRSVVHSETFSHAVKDSPSILNFQVVQSHEGKIAFRYLANGSFNGKEIEEIRRRLSKIHPELGKVSFERVSSLEQTIAGKTKRILSLKC